MKLRESWEFVVNSHGSMGPHVAMMVTDMESRCLVHWDRWFGAHCAW